MTPYTPPNPDLYDGITTSHQGRFRTTENGYTESQLRSEVERVRRETVEECARVCDQEAADADSAKRKPLLTPTGKTLYEGMWGGASNCAATIRGLLE